MTKAETAKLELEKARLDVRLKEMELEQKGKPWSFKFNPTLLVSILSIACSVVAASEAASIAMNQSLDRGLQREFNQDHGPDEFERKIIADAIVAAKGDPKKMSAMLRALAYTGVIRQNEPVILKYADLTDTEAHKGGRK